MNPNLKNARMIALCPSALLSSLTTFSVAQNVPLCFIYPSTLFKDIFSHSESTASNNDMINE